MCSALAGIVGAENKQLRNHYKARADELEARDTTARSESFSGRLIRCANYLSRPKFLLLVWRKAASHVSNGALALSMCSY